MMLMPSKMVRIRFTIPKACYDETVTFLGESSIMQLEELPDKVKEMFLDYNVDDYEKINSYLQRMRSLRSILPATKSGTVQEFKSNRQAFRSADSIKIDETVAKIKKEQEEILSEIKDARSELEIIRTVSDLRGNLNVLNTSYTDSFIATGSRFDDFASYIKGKTDADTIKLSKCGIVTVPKASEGQLAGAASAYGISLNKLPVFHGDVASESTRIKKRIKHLEISNRNAQKRLASISKEYYNKISALEEYLDIEAQKASLVTRVKGSEYLVILEGWMEQKNLDRVKERLNKISKGAFLAEEIENAGLAPTQMQNPVTFKLYEFFIKFYSLPKSNEIDPTILFGIAFPIFFGFMVGDFGYGAIMLGLALWLVHRINHPPKRSRIPRSISRFIRTIMSKRSLLMIAKVIIPGSIIAMFLGVIFNKYLGFSLPYPTLFNLTENVGTLLLISGWIGVCMVSFGFFLGALNKLYVKDIKGMIGRIGWILAAWGIVILGLAVLNKESIGPSNISALASYALLIVGIGLILKSEGGQALMEVPSVVSHMLSYTRLVGILLASVILAQVINLIFVSSLSGSIFVIFAGVAILVLGQIFNIVIALFEAGIQGARLIYVEFFSKFLSGNGNQFNPFRIKRHAFQQENSSKAAPTTPK